MSCQSHELVGQANLINVMMMITRQSCKLARRLSCRPKQCEDNRENMSGEGKKIGVTGWGGRKRRYWS